MPLSIELAAARLRVMSVKEMVSQMGAALDWLVDPRGSKETRHRSLRTSIEWSCRLLPMAHRAALNALALFGGGFRAESAMYVCSDTVGSEVASLNMLEDLASASLITTAEDSTGVTWFRMVEALRGFALEQLARSGCEGTVRLRHLNWCLGLAGQARRLGTADPAMKELDANWRSALEFGLSEPESHDILIEAMRLAEALTPYWLARGYLTEGRDWLRRALGRSKGDEMRMRLSSSMAILAVPQGDYAEAEQLARSAIGLAENLGESRHIAINQSTLGQLAFRQGRYSESTERSQKALDIHRALGDTEACIDCLKALGMTAWYESNHQLAQTRIEDALHLARTIGNRHTIADALLKLGNIARDQGDDVAARPLLDESLQIFRDLDVPRDIACALHDLGLLHIGKDNVIARAYFREAYRYFHEIGIRSSVASSLHNLGQLFLFDGELAEAKKYTEDALAIYRSLGDRRNISASLHNLAVITERQGGCDRAMQMLTEAVELDEQIGNRQGMAIRGVQIALNRLIAGNFEEAERWAQSALKIDLELRAWPLSDSLLVCALLDLERSRHSNALRLAAAANAFRESVHSPYTTEFTEMTDRIRACVMQALDETVVNALWRQGQAMSPEEALAAAPE
jgi:tetratricopeptide (TPR) repeat protein